MKIDATSIHILTGSKDVKPYAAELKSVAESAVSTRIRRRFLVCIKNMKNQKIVFQGKSKKGLNIVIRYPDMSDLKEVWKYANTLSKERTFVLFQGERMSLKSEREWLGKLIESNKKKLGINLLAVVGQKVIGICGIQAKKKKIHKHIGNLAISVARNFRGEGIGWLLMNAVLEETKKKLKYLKTITLEVFEENRVARVMYKKIGFKEISVSCLRLCATRADIPTRS